MDAFERWYRASPMGACVLAVASPFLFSATFENVEGPIGQRLFVAAIFAGMPEGPAGAPDRNVTTPIVKGFGS